MDDVKKIRIRMPGSTDLETFNVAQIKTAPLGTTVLDRPVTGMVLGSWETRLGGMTDVGLEVGNGDMYFLFRGLSTNKGNMLILDSHWIPRVGDHVRLWGMDECLRVSLDQSIPVGDKTAFLARNLANDSCFLLMYSGTEEHTFVDANDEGYDGAKV